MYSRDSGQEKEQISTYTYIQTVIIVTMNTERRIADKTHVNMFVR